MRNKKGFADPYTIVIVAGIIILVLIFGWYNTSSESKKEIDVERERNTQLENQLYEVQTDLDEANKVIQNQTSQINQLNIELNQYRNSYGYFPLLWIENIQINEFWVLVINISLFSFSLITIKFILRLGKRR